ncbi:hypothetical protein LCGC14_0335090 [marine sediment metagenome]|uniref:Uncharacterized protein n=1 Tax=marine sediment metagenome TaxID=412755 RepID=A0A0F9W2W6_9ZZZZ
MKDKHKRTILRLELEVEASKKAVDAAAGEIVDLRTSFLEAQKEAEEAISERDEAKEELEEVRLDATNEHEELSGKVKAAKAELAGQKILLDEAVGAVKQSIIETEEARDERDGVQTENEELRQTLSSEREDWRRERGTLEFRVSEAESQAALAAERHQRLGG